MGISHAVAGCVAACLAGAAVVAATARRPEYRTSTVCWNNGEGERGKPFLVVVALDTTGFPLPGTEVQVTRDGTVVKSGSTDGTGRLVMEGLPAGKVWLRAHMHAFVDVDTEVVLQAGCTTALAALMEVGSVGVD
jgi:hypothetical protein